MRAEGSQSSDVRVDRECGCFGARPSWSQLFVVPILRDQAERGHLARNCSQCRSGATKLVVLAHHRILSCMLHLQAIATKMLALQGAITWLLSCGSGMRAESDALPGYSSFGS